MTSFPDTVRKIITHINPDLDELYGIYLLRTYGLQKFPGITKASIEVWGKGADAPDGRPIEDHVQEGALFVGRGGIHFDEHPTATQDRVEDECATTLIAQYLGITENPDLIQTLAYVLKHDNEGGNEHYGLGSLIKILRIYWNADELYTWLLPVFKVKHLDAITRDWVNFSPTSLHLELVYSHLKTLHPDAPASDRQKAIDFVLKRYQASKSPFGLAYLYYVLWKQEALTKENAWQWLVQALDLCMDDQINYHKEVREFPNHSKLTPIQLSSGKKLRLVTAESDSRYTVKVAFSRNLGDTADILIVKSSATKQVQILSNALSRDLYNFKDIVKELRLTELKKLGNTETFDNAYLTREGNITEVPQWFYHVSLEALLNGSFSTPNIPPTTLSLDEIEGVVKRSLNKLEIQ